MKKCLFLVCLCLVPIVVFSSTSFTSQNPIELPASVDEVIWPVEDVRGNPLDPRSSYRIVSVFWGALGGDVCLGPSPNSSATCDNGVFRYNSDLGPPGTPVRFIGIFPLSRGVLENTDINFRFTIPPVAANCVDYTIWKVGDYDESLGARLLETGGIVSHEGGWFRIVKSVKPPVLGYNLFYCPGPFLPLDQCQEVSVVIQDGKRRLALVDDQSEAVTFPLPVGFAKV